MLRAERTFFHGVSRYARPAYPALLKSPSRPRAPSLYVRADHGVAWGARPSHVRYNAHEVG